MAIAGMARHRSKTKHFIIDTNVKYLKYFSVVAVIIGTSKMQEQPGIGLRMLTNPLTVRNQYIYLGAYDLRGKVYGGFNFSDGIWTIKQDGAASLRTGARRSDPKGMYVTFNVYFDTIADATAFRLYCVNNSQDADIPLFIRDSSWFFKVWGINLKQLPMNRDSPMDYYFYYYEVICYLYSPYAYQTPAIMWYASNATLPRNSNLLPNSGHYAVPFDDLKVTCYYNAAHVAYLTLTVSGQTPLVITDHALSSEIWQLFGNENRLLETYTDAISSIAQFNQDVTKSGTVTYSGGYLLFENVAYAYYKLSGPNPARYPVKMTADLSLDSGGATGLAYVEISSDGISWTTALTQADFEVGEAEYWLNGSEFMQNIHVRIRNASGTIGKYLRLGSIKFEIERWIEDGGVPTIPTGTSSTRMALSSTGSTLVDIVGYFRSIEHLM